MNNESDHLTDEEVLNNRVKSSSIVSTIQLIVPSSRDILMTFQAVSATAFPIPSSIIFPYIFMHLWENVYV